MPVYIRLDHIFANQNPTYPYTSASSVIQTPSGKTCLVKIYRDNLCTPKKARISGVQTIEGADTTESTLEECVYGDCYEGRGKSKNITPIILK